MEVHFEPVNLEATHIAHHLPCTIKFNGKAESARAFCPFPEPMESFRGRRLESAPFEVHESLQAFVVEQLGNDDSQKGAFPGKGERIQIKCKLEKKGVLYQHDTVPTPQSSLLKALQWAAISEALHSPVNPKDISSTNAEEH